MKDTTSLFCPQPGPNRPKEMYEAINRWTNLPAMQRLVSLFGGNWDHQQDLDERLRFLESCSDRWDFRRGAERLDAVRVSLSSQQEHAVQQAASDLGLTIAVPPRRTTYDYVLVLGGVALSCKLRTEHAAKLVHERHVQTRAVVLLGSSRRIPENEREIADSFAPGSVTEFDMMSAAAEAAFRLNRGYDNSVTHHENENLASIVRRYRRSLPPDIVSLSAPSFDANRRANTEDTYAFVAKVVNLQPRQNVLICTSQIYLPFHLLSAMRMLALPYDVQVEVVGFPIERAHGPAALRGTNNLLQEIRSGIQAAVRLKESLDALT